ncbi:MAG: sugar ABC transporter permease [Chloroflexi bacterium]|nr:sugar ABC transporter permease [Chloroflexota bacterium]
MATVTRIKRKNSMARKEAIAFHLFISPWLIGFVVFTLGPMVASFLLSFTKYNVSQPPQWVGLGNWVRAFTKDPLFYHSFKVTFIYAFTAVPLQLVAGLIVALLLNANIPAISFWRTLYYIPSVLSGVAVAVLWRLAFHPTNGIINTVLRIFGIKGPAWIYDPKWALQALIVMSLWGIGGGMIIYLSGLQGIPTALYEAATIDGAGRWRRFWNITLPMITPILFFNLVMGVIHAMETFTTAFVMTEGGPQNATLFIGLRIYFSAFRDLLMGYASTLAWSLFIVIMLLTLLIIRSSSFWVYYEGMKR